MCTAITLKTNDFYFGRTLDYEKTFGESVVITPRQFPLEMRHCSNLKSHYAIIGMATVRDNYPLYYDAVNEHGLCMAGLNFIGNAKYSDIDNSKINVAQFELLPYILGLCQNIEQVKDILKNLNIVGTDFNNDLPAASLHWIIADSDCAITLESTKEGVSIYENPVGVLTNNPEFDKQMFSLNNYMSLSNASAKNTFSDRLNLHEYSRGMGAIGLPGDLSSQSRFVRACFTKLNSYLPENEDKSVAQFFHILSNVSQTKGCCVLENGDLEHTIYTSCCNASKGIYYYTTYSNPCINAVCLNEKCMSAKMLLSYNLKTKLKVNYQN